MYVCVYVHRYMRVWICIYIYIYIHTSLSLSISLSIYLSLSLSLSIYIYIDTRVCVYTYIYIYIHIHIHTCVDYIQLIYNYTRYVLKMKHGSPPYEDQRQHVFRAFSFPGSHALLLGTRPYMQQ